jgi:hypothetical protein
MASHTSEILPASFRVPSTLETGMGQLSVLVTSRFHLTKSEWANRSVAPQSSSAFDTNTSPVSVVCIATLSSNDFELRDEAMT